MATPTTPKSDNPLQNTTLSRLAKIEAGEPYVYTCRDGKHTVTFPDLSDMDWEEGEKFMQDMLKEPESVWIPRYVSEEDWKRFQAEKLKMREFVPIIRDVLDYYQKIFGDEGEEQASHS